MSGVGSTLLAVTSEAADSLADVRSETDVHTLLTGAAADVRGLAAAHALVEALEGAPDVVAIEGAVRAWGTEHLQAAGVELQRVSDPHRRSTAVDEQLEQLGSTAISVPVPCADPLRLLIRFPASQGVVTDAVRRTLVVAGRIVGATVGQARLIEVAEAEAASLRTIGVGSARTFIGTSPDATHLATLIPRLGASDVSVLVEGETGVGKTFVARLIHEASPRAREPLRVINCAAIPENLLESELF